MSLPDKKHTPVPTPEPKKPTPASLSADAKKKADASVAEKDANLKLCIDTGEQLLKNVEANPALLEGAKFGVFISPTGAGYTVEETNSVMPEGTAVEWAPETAQFHVFVKA